MCLYDLSPALCFPLIYYYYYYYYYRRGHHHRLHPHYSNKMAPNSTLSAKVHPWVYLCVYHDAHNQQLLFPYTALSIMPSFVEDDS